MFPIEARQAIQCLECVLSPSHLDAVRYDTERRYAGIEHGYESLEDQAKARKNIGLEY